MMFFEVISKKVVPLQPQNDCVEVGVLPRNKLIITDL